MMIVPRLLTQVLPSLSLHMNIFFSSYQDGEFGKFKMGNQVSSKISGIGDINLITSIGCQLMLKDRRHVLDMCLNFILVGKLDDAVWLITLVVEYESSPTEV